MFSNLDFGVSDSDRMKSSKVDGHRSIQERVKQFYYKIGLFCSSNPYSILFISATIIIVSCYPLLHLPLPGSKPQEFTTENFDTKHSEGHEYSSSSDQDPGGPRWLSKGQPPAVFIQQIIVKSYGNPNKREHLNDNVLRDVFRHVFRIVENIRNVPNLGKNCFHVHEVKPKVLKEKSMLPEDECLIVSPANFWQGNVDKFEKDRDIIGTILNYQSHEKGRSGLAEILLGMNVRETGLKIYPFQRTAGSRRLTYAVTIVLGQLDQDFQFSLKSKLSEYKIKTSNKTSYIYYPPNTSYFELIPLALTYIVLFVYIYFSMKKIEIIRSKLLVAFAALLTIIASLCMSFGLCSSFGMMNFEVSGKTIFPYLIGIVGLENVLVMTRSVVSTNVNLDVKIRLAQGLSNEGWSITKNLFTEVTILTIGFFTFFPRIQEFCILAIVGLLSDFFLQTFFFGTILSLDIRRPEHPIVHRYAQPLRTPVHPTNSPMSTPPSTPSSNSGGIIFNKTNVPNASNIHVNNHGPTNPGVVVAPSAPIYIAKIPKRLRLVYFWAKTRFFQRTFMIFMVGWISVIVYEVSLGFLESEFEIVLPPVKHHSVVNVSGGGSASNFVGVIGRSYHNNLTLPPGNFEVYDGYETVIKRSNHWQTLISIYNVSLTGKYIRVLPSINLILSQRFFVDGGDKKFNFNWEAISSHQSGHNYDDLSATATKKSLYTLDDPYIPSSPMELALTILLAIPSLIFICYSMVVFYRCICSRNYAEWRSSWNSNHDKSQDSYTQVVFEAVPLVLTGHVQEVECMGCDGSTIASVCLNGVLKVWNVNAENIASVDRKRYFEGTTDTETDSNDEENTRANRKEPEGKMSKEPVWCLDIEHSIIALGTGTGRLEVWDSFTGALRSIYDEGAKSGIMCVKIIGNRVVLARLNGSLDFILLESADGSTSSRNHSNPYHRWSVTEETQARLNSSVVEGELRCVWLTTLRAHQQPITCLDAEGGRIISGSQDHSLKVFRLLDNTHVYTLHGHYGPITCLFIDKDSPMTSGSGSQDGMLCVWDLQTGMCMYSIQAHDGPTIGLTYSTSYVISVGGDDKICVWERFQGHLLNTIQLDQAYCSSLVMLTYNLLITSKQGSLIVWDVQSGEPVRSVRLGHRDNTVFVRQIINCGGAVLCDYGSQLRLVRFPSLVLANKLE